MAVVNKVDQKIKTDLGRTIEYQIITYCFFHDIQISAADLKTLAELAHYTDISMTEFCELVTTIGIFKSAQSARNAITKATKKGLILKDGKNRKVIRLNDRMNVQTEAPVFLDYKILGIETEEL